MPLDPSLPFSRFGTAPESPPDDRDHLVTRYMATIQGSQLPDEVGMDNIALHKKYVGITNQMQEGSCTGHGARNTKSVAELRIRKTASQRRSVPQFGPRGIYTLAKQIGGYPEEEGAYLRDVCKALATYGTPREQDWPYVAKFDDQGKAQDIGTPKKAWMTNAKHWQIGAYARARTIDQMLTTLHTIGPLFIAMDLHENFFTPDPEGVIPMPSGQVVGGHCTAILGAVQSTRRWFCANSWSAEWGLGGYYWLDFDHFTQVRGEAWTIPDYVAA